MTRVLVVGMDGLRFDILRTADAPVLHGLMAHGAHGTGLLPYGRGTGAPPTVAYTGSGPGWSSIATGVWPDKHGVLDNTFETADYAKYPDFLTRARQAGKRTFGFISWAKLGTHRTFGPPTPGRLIVVDGAETGFRNADADAVASTDLDVDVAFVYFGGTDEVGHARGPLCTDYTDALRDQDRYLGDLLARLDDDWTVLVTTDHGHLDQGGHGGDSLVERTTFVILDTPSGPPRGEILPQPQHVDIAPTVLNLLGIPIDPAWQFDGHPLLSGGTAGPTP